MKTVLFALCFAPAMVLAQKPAGFDILSLDRSVDPCANLYRYACGGWMTANPLPPDQARFGAFNKLQDQNRIVLQTILESASSNKPSRSVIEREIGDFYFSCMDEKSIEARGIAPLKTELNRIAALKDKKNLVDLLIVFFKSGTPAFFQFSSEQDPRNAIEVIGALDQPGLGLPDRDYYLKTDTKSVDLRAQYAAHVARMLELVGSRPAAAQKKAQAVLAVETELAKGSFDRVTRRDPEKVYHKMTVQELGSLAPNFDWAKFFKGIGAPPIESLNVAVPAAAQAFSALVDRSSLDDLKTYLAWNLVHAAVLTLPASFSEENFKFYGRILTGQKEIRARWKRCVDATDNLLPEALGRMFVEKTLGEEGKLRTREMAGEIEKAFEKNLQAIDWMAPQTKEQALAKLHTVMNKIGNQEKWLDYSSVKITRNDPFGNEERASGFAVVQDLEKIGKPVDKASWGMSQPTVNAYYDPQQNNINFPAGILQPPFWDKSKDDAVNYGAIGIVIGHELTHGFDDEGRQYDATGNLRDWWTEADAKAFEQRADCLVKEYGDFTTVDDVKLNGRLTLGENTADNGGARLAYMALLDRLAVKQPDKIDGFTAQQRFFLGFAQVWCENMTNEERRRRAVVDPHSPGEFRVNGVVSNMPEFRQAFSCREGQPMVRAQACRIW